MSGPPNRPKTATEIADMRVGGKIIAQIYRELRAQVRSGVSERELDQWVAREIAALGATPTYKEPSVDFPGVVCISVNDEIVHGVPSDRELEKGDVVSFDLVITYNDMKTDAAFTMVVGGEVKGDKKRLLEATEQSLYAGIKAVRSGATTGDIGAAVSRVLAESNLGIIRELVGHGVGHEMHESPDVPNYGSPGVGTVLEKGMTLAIEPMATLGGERIVHDKKDGWTIRTRDKSLSAHFEHTVLVTENGAEILTQ